MRHPRLCFRRLLLITSFVSALPSVARAQLFADVVPGRRVQLTMRDSLRPGPLAPARQIVIGQFVRATVDSVWIRPAGATEFGVARSTIKGARVSRGASRMRSALTFGASLGFAFAVGVAIDQIDTDRDHRGRDVLIAGGLGVGGGLLIGALSPYEHWRRLRD